MLIDSINNRLFWPRNLVSQDIYIQTYVYYCESHLVKYLLEF
jgi:hypothetical protein